MMTSGAARVSTIARQQGVSLSARRWVSALAARIEKVSTPTEITPLLKNLRLSGPELLESVQVFRTKLNSLPVEERREVTSHEDFEAWACSIANEVLNGGSLDSVMLATRAYLALFPQQRGNVPSRSNRLSAKVMIDAVTEGKVTAVSLGGVLKCIGATSTGNLQLLSWVDSNAANLISSADVPTVLSMLHGYYDLVDGRPSSVTLLSAAFNRIAAQMDTFRNVDVVQCCALFRMFNFVHSDVATRCMELVKQHGALFEATQLVNVVYDTTSIRRMTPAGARAVVEEIKPRVKTVSTFALWKLLNVCSNQCRDVLVADEVISLMLAAPDSYRGTTPALALCHAICAHNFLERKDLLDQIITELLSNRTLDRDSSEIMIDIIEAANSEFGLKITPPQAFLDNVAKHNAALKLPQGFVATLSNLPAHLKLDLATNAPVGPFCAAAVDESKKLAIFLSSQVAFGSALRSRLLKNMGYTMRVITPANFAPRTPMVSRERRLVRIVTSALVSQGKMTPLEADEILSKIQ